MQTDTTSVILNKALEALQAMHGVRDLGVADLRALEHILLKAELIYRQAQVAKQEDDGDGA